MIKTLIRSMLPMALLSLGAAAAASDWITYSASPQPGQSARTEHIVLLSGDEEYRSEEALPLLGKILSQRHGFKCTVLFAVDPDGSINPDNQGSLPGAEALDTADAIVMSLRFRNWPDTVMKQFAAAFNRGVPIIGLRTSTHAFRFPGGRETEFALYNTFGKRVLGEDWVSHWGRHKLEATRGVIEEAAKDHPVLRGVTGIFGDTDVYEAYPPADATILLRGEVVKGMNPGDPPADYRKRRSRGDRQEQAVNEPMMAVAWARVHQNESGKRNRIFCTTLGSATDLKNEGLRRLIVNSVYWGLDLTVPQRADVALVDDYQPTAYGFGGYRRGMKPGDFTLGKPIPPSGTPPAPSR